MGRERISTEAVFRIGEVARRTGVAATTLRAWERRHRLFSPARTGGGQRLYSAADVARVQEVQRLLAEGWSLPGAVARALATEDDAGDGDDVDEADADVARDEIRSRAPSPSHRARGEPGVDARGRIIDLLANADPFAVLSAYEAERDLLRAESPNEVRAILVQLVERLEGETGEAAVQDDVVIPIDLSFGEGEPLLPRAAPGTLARMRLEIVLPLVVEDARLRVQQIQLGNDDRVAKAELARHLASD